MRRLLPEGKEVLFGCGREKRETINRSEREEETHSAQARRGHKGLVFGKRGDHEEVWDPREKAVGVECQKRIMEKSTSLRYLKSGEKVQSGRLQKGVENQDARSVKRTKRSAPQL